MFDWNDMRFFVEVSRAGSYALAGRRLGCAHTTVSRRIAALEDALGARLFERMGDLLQLTAEGEAVAGLAQRMEDTALAIADRAVPAGTAITGSVRVGAPDGIGNAFLSRVLPELLAEQPGLAIELVPVPVTHKLWKRDVDIAISLDRPETGRVVMRRLVDYDLRIYGAPALLEEKGMPQAMDDLPAFPFAGYIDDLLFSGALDFNKAVHPGLRVRYKAATVKAQMDAVLSGMALGVLPCFLARGTGLVPVLPDDVAFTRTYWLLYPEELREIERIRVVAAHIARRVRENAAIFRFNADLPQGHSGSMTGEGTHATRRAGAQENNDDG